MKLKIGDKVYLQKYEVAYIWHELWCVPGGIFEETFTDDVFIMNGPSDGLKFECVYRKPENIKWLMAQDWLIDYEEYAKMSLEELKAVHERLVVKYHADINNFNTKSRSYRETHFAEKNEELKILEHKITSIGGMIGHCKGELRFGFPDGYCDGNDDYSETNSTDNEDSLLDGPRNPISGSLDSTNVADDSGANNSGCKKLGFFAKIFGRHA